MFAFKLKVFIVTAGEVNGFTHLHRVEGGLCSESCLSARGHGKKIQSTPYMMLLVLSLIKLCKKRAGWQKQLQQGTVASMENTRLPVCDHELQVKINH